MPSLPPDPDAYSPGAGPPSDDAALVARVRAGSRAAAEQLAADTYSQLFASCCRLTGDADRAADLVQETYRRAWQALPAFRGESRFSTWLFRIAYTTFLKQQRRPRLVEPLAPEATDLVPDESPGPERNAARRERERILRAQVAALPDDLRLTVVAHYWGETPVREIAAAEQITPMGVRKRLAKALRLLSTSLSEVSQ